MHLRTSVWALVALGATLLAAGSANAQGAAGTGAPEPQAESPAATDTGVPTPAAAPRKKAIEEIVIQAGESDAASDFEAGDSVAAFDASDLEALGAQSVADLAAFTPNLEIVTSGATTPTFFIRGVGLNDFNANSSGAVAVYQNDVPLNTPALQLGSLFDVDAVNILRGPQGVGPFRNASAGAIKIYARKPTGEFGGYLNQSYGNHDFMDYEGAVEAPIYEDILSGRFAFRYSERDGWMRNGCGDAPAIEDRGVNVNSPPTTRFNSAGLPISICGEPVPKKSRLPLSNPPTGISDIAEGLPSRVNDLNNWSARGSLLFQPTLDMEWLLIAQGSRRDEQSRLGQALGTKNFDVYDPACLTALSDADFGSPAVVQSCQLTGSLGGTDEAGYRSWEVTRRFRELSPCVDENGAPEVDANGMPVCPPETRIRVESTNNAYIALAEELSDLDSEPFRGDFNRVGPTKNDVWGVSLKGDIVLGDSVYMNTVSGYNTYDRLIDVDLDFSPTVLFEFVTEDTAWQFTQDLSFSGQVSENLPVRWEVGAFYLMEELEVAAQNFFAPKFASFAVKARDYHQSLQSAASWIQLSWDFWEDFTLDGGFRYNWEHKSMDYLLTPGTGDPRGEFADRTWQAPTGTVRLTYRFREDTHAYLKYTRGWKGGHFNATGSGTSSQDFETPIVEAAEPETIDAFEAGLRGSWLGGLLGANGSVFHYNYENYQIFTARQLLGGSPEFVILNANNAEVYGAELDLVARPWDGLYLQARLAWLESRFLDFVQVQQERTPTGLVTNRVIQNTGNPLLNSPNYKVSLTAEQTLPLGRYGSVTARWDGAWTDDSFYDGTEGLGLPNAQGVQVLPENTIGQRAYWLHNLRLSYRVPSGNVEIAGWVRNLANKSYKTFAFDGSSFQQTTIYFVGEPRMFGGSVNVNF